MAFDVNNFVIDRVRRGIMLNSNTGVAMWSLNQVESPQLTVTAETGDAVDALGTPIMTFNRAKNAEFSAENSLLDLSLMAAQGGTEKRIATASDTIITPIFDEIKVTSADQITLSRTPYVPFGETYGCKYIYKLNGDGTLGMKYAAAATAGAGTYTIVGKNITLDTGAARVGEMFLAIYEYEATDAVGMGAVEIKNTAKDYPKGGRFVLEVLGVDVCDPSTLYSAYLIFPNAKLLSDFDLSFTTDSKHPFQLKAMQDYCDHEKLLFRLVVPELM